MAVLRLVLVHPGGPEARAGSPEANDAPHDERSSIPPQEKVETFSPFLDLTLAGVFFRFCFTLVANICRHTSFCYEMVRRCKIAVLLRLRFRCGGHLDCLVLYVLSKYLLVTHLVEPRPTIFLRMTRPTRTRSHRMTMSAGSQG
jgi:hypothetical protein